MSVRGAHTTITQAVTAWPNVSAHPHRFGGTEYRYGDKREIGHLHTLSAADPRPPSPQSGETGGGGGGDSWVDIPFPAKVRDELVAAGRAEAHHILPESGWISFYIRQPEDVARAIELFRLSYELAMKQRTVKSKD